MTLLAKKRILAKFTLGLYSLNLIYLFYLAMLTVNVLLPLDRCGDLELCRCLWRCCSLGVARRVHSASIYTHCHVTHHARSMGTHLLRLRQPTKGA